MDGPIYLCMLERAHTMIYVDRHTHIHKKNQPTDQPTNQLKPKQIAKSGGIEDDDGVADGSSERRWHKHLVIRCM